MSTPTASKSRLFLMELLIMIFFIAVSSAICVQLFVKAYTCSQDSTALTHAVTLSQSTASILKGTEFSPEALTAQWPEGTTSGSTFTLGLDQDWMPCNQASAAYVLSVTFTKDSLATAQVSIGHPGSSTPLYTLTISEYQEDTL